MIGIHYSKRPATKRRENIDVFDTFLIKEEWHRINKLFSNDGEKYDDRMVASVYDNYPISTWEDEDSIYVVEGIIYNISEASVRERLNGIANSFSKDQVSCLVKEADGDFVAAIYKKKTKIYLSILKQLYYSIY